MVYQALDEAFFITITDRHVRTNSRALFFDTLEIKLIAFDCMDKLLRKVLNFQCATTQFELCNGKLGFWREIFRNREVANIHT